jgi:hypothetical protein
MEAAHATPTGSLNSLVIQQTEKPRGTRPGAPASAHRPGGASDGRAKDAASGQTKLRRPRFMEKTPWNLELINSTCLAIAVA